jgi:hypothetical protein
MRTRMAEDLSLDQLAAEVRPVGVSFRANVQTKPRGATQGLSNAIENGKGNRASPIDRALDYRDCSRGWLFLQPSASADIPQALSQEPDRLSPCRSQHGYLKHPRTGFQCYCLTASVVWQRPHGRNLLKYFGRRYLIALDASSRVEFSAAKSNWVLRGVRVSAADMFRHWRYVSCGAASGNSKAIIAPQPIVATDTLHCARSSLPMHSSRSLNLCPITDQFSNSCSALSASACPMLGANREESVHASIALHGREPPMRAVYDVTIHSAQ